METDFTLKNVNKILGIKESFKAPDRLMEIMFDQEKRINVFNKFLDLSKDVSFDWFHQYFQEEQAERKTNKQDFTPNEVSKLLTELSPTKPGDMYFETAAGTGGLTIKNWWEACLQESPLTYMPHEHMYYVEELSDRAIPFLLFNLTIRGMNAIVWHGDSLERTCRGVFFLQNDSDNAIGFSSLNVMPYNKTIQKEFRINEWTGEPYPDHVESNSQKWAENVDRNMMLKRKWGDLFD